MPFNHQGRCIVIMGPYRSGTSLVAQILHELGVQFGPEEAFQLPPDRYNPGGYFQRKDIVEANRLLIETASNSIATPLHPDKLLESTSNGFRPQVDLTWTDGLPVWGMKDPRFCATLQTWVRSGVLDPSALKLVRVRRNIEAIARSTINHREVGSFCDYDLSKAGTMATLYDSHASWHCVELGLPHHVIDYESLIARPRETVMALADFVGCTVAEAHERCLKRIGKRRALVWHYIKKLTNPRQTWETAQKTVKSLMTR